ncbi:MAG: general secretion pathway protein GspB [Methylococcales bacterium]|nr:general secretion pathway protein GspB [Methylococcales bacterium]
MSLILNALKKSEQERLASQSDKLEHKLLNIPVKKENKRFPVWGVLLILINVIILLFFVGSYFNNAKLEVQQAKKKSNNHTIQPAPPVVADAVKPKKEKPAVVAFAPPPAKERATEEASLVQLMKEQKEKKRLVEQSQKVEAEALAQQSNKVEMQPIVTKKHTMMTLFDDKESSNTPHSIKVKESIEKEPLQAKIAEEVIDILAVESIQVTLEGVSLEETGGADPFPLPVLAEPSSTVDLASSVVSNEVQDGNMLKMFRGQKPLPTEPIAPSSAAGKKPTTQAKASTNDEPFLLTLPRDFRRSVPPLNINVFYYSAIEDERFIMVSMKKFQANDEIAEGMYLEEIREHSIVVSYDEKRFQIQR